jgi:hypothetical protein
MAIMFFTVIVKAKLGGGVGVGNNRIMVKLRWLDEKLHFILKEVE